MGDAGARVEPNLTSVVAVSWNLLWNRLFENWEQRPAAQSRTIASHKAHLLLGFDWAAPFLASA